MDAYIMEHLYTTSTSSAQQCTIQYYWCEKANIVPSLTFSYSYHLYNCRSLTKTSKQFVTHID